MIILWEKPNMQDQQKIMQWGLYSLR